MVDILALAISHGLLLLAAWRLLWRPDLDEEKGRSDEPPSRKGIRTMKVRRDEPGGSDA